MTASALDRPARVLGESLLWPLARSRDVARLQEACRALRSARHVLGADAERAGLEYALRCGRAFELALVGEREEALGELRRAWQESMISLAGYALNRARIHYLAGEYELAVRALALAAGAADADDASVDDILVLCLAARPDLRYGDGHGTLRSGAIEEGLAIVGEVAQMLQGNEDEDAPDRAPAGSQAVKPARAERTATGVELRPRDAELADDYWSGEDEPWLSADLLGEDDNENPFRFTRTLAIAALAGTAFWTLVALALARLLSG